MKERRALALCLIFSTLAAQTAAQVAPRQAPAPPTSPPPQQRDSQTADEVVRVTSNLVQVDVTVTDKDGRPVTDLRPEDFEIYEDGRRKEITNFSFVSVGAGATGGNGKADSPEGNDAARPAATNPTARPAPPPTNNRKPAPVVPPVPLRREQVHRTVALVVDDLGLSAESMATVRQALKKFVDEQMREGDLVAVLRTRGGAGTLERFTTDRRALHAAIERVRWFPVSRADDISAAGTLQPDAADALAQKSMRELLEFRRESLGVGTLNALSFAVRGMRDLPGRKSVVLFSESFLLRSSDSRSVIEGYADFSSRMGRALVKLVEAANRASTVVYTINPAGLQTLGLTAADGRPRLIPDLQLQTAGGGALEGNSSGNSAAQAQVIRPGQGTTEAGILQMREAIDARRTRFEESQEVLDYVARETGGLSVRNGNDLGEGLARVMQDQAGYYLLGYRPDEKTFDAGTGRPTFRRISVRVKRAGLRARTRSGFFAVEDEAPRDQSPAARLRDALLSPFASGDIDVRLTSFFADEPQGPVVQSLLHLDARGLAFRQEADGTRRAAVEVLAVTFNAGGSVVDRVLVNKNIEARADAFGKLLDEGVVSVLNVPVKQPGAYQLRVAVRDAASGRVGSASQFVEVPDLTKNRLALSGIVLSGSRRQTGAAPFAATDVRAAFASDDVRSGPALRRLRQGMVMEYGYLVYNAQADPQTGRPRLSARMRLLRDGKVVFEGAEQPLDPRGQQDLKRVVGGGRFQIGRDLAPGQYVLQVVVTDALAREKNQTATQWLDFEITD